MKLKILLAAGMAIFCSQAAFAQFQVGQKVSYNDRLMKFGGGTVQGTIVEDRGPGWEYAQRWIRTECYSPGEDG